MGLKPGTNTERIERSTQATPLAEDVLKQLQGELSQGAFGFGVGPAQRFGVSNAMDLYNKMLAGRGVGGIDPTGFLDALGKRSSEFTDRQAMDQRDIFGAGGSRFGSQVMQGETDLRRGAASDYAVTSAQSLLDAGKFNAQLGLSQDQQLLAGLGQIFGMGTEAINPFLAMASQGILPEEIVREPNFMSKLLNTGARIGAAYLTGGGSELANQVGGGDMFDIFGNSSSTFENMDPNVFTGNSGIGLQDPANRAAANVNSGNMMSSFDPNSVFFGTFGNQTSRLPKFGMRGGR